ncbi:transposase [Paenibacillus sp.]|uniref:IS110 family transposase n=1 Tax=Paenibacillus sp. TaxID=58172 RepID=UPI0028A9EECE|nr:transposase [Paenibacillus sp.]
MGIPVNTFLGGEHETLHTPKGFEKLNQLLAELERMTNQKPVIILEPTGHYHRVLVLHLQKSGYEVILVNPLHAQRARKTGLRKVKTDSSDAWHLGDLYYQEENWTIHSRRKESLEDLQFLTRQHEFITSLYVQSKLNMRSLVDQISPSYEGVFKDLFSKTSLNLLEACLTQEGIQERTTEAWTDIVKISTKASRSEAYVR